MAQVGITLRRLDLGMPQKALHLVQAAPRVDQEAGILNSTLPSTFSVIGDPRLNEINELRWFLC